MDPVFLFIIRHSLEGWSWAVSTRAGTITDPLLWETAEKALEQAQNFARSNMRVAT
jgi:hypothetical protein